MKLEMLQGHVEESNGHILAERFQGFLATFGIPEDLSVFLIGIPLLILAIYLNYKK